MENVIIEQSEIRKYLHRYAFEMINQDFKAQGRKCKMLADILDLLQGARGSKFRIFPHACAVSALFINYCSFTFSFEFRCTKGISLLWFRPSKAIALAETWRRI